MSILVQKFGGTSVADADKILVAAKKAVEAQAAGHQVVMVVSAMGKNTDMLIDLAGQINDRPPAREMDMLLATGEQVSVALMAMAIDALGHKAVSLTGAQIGIKTDSSHTKARIQSIATDRMRRLLDEGNIVIAAGFQGTDDDWNITTLGRGGSDLTAVALAAVLDASACEIYTDVPGVFTTDPRLLPEARQIDQVSYDEMLELASLGAGVLHSRSVEFAKKYQVPIHVRSSESGEPGTIVLNAPESLDRPVGGAALTEHEARLTVSGVPDRPGTSWTIFSRIAARNIAIDMIVQNLGHQGEADLSFTVLGDDLPATREAVAEAIAELGSGSLDCDEQVAKVSVVGLGMATQTGVADRMFRTLGDAGVNILMITTSEIKISTLVPRDQSRVALAAVHAAFHLDQPPADANRPDMTRNNGRPSDAMDLVARLAGMEDLMIDDVTLDASQGSITLTDIPDRPGIVATLFQEVAATGIFVDMIVQSAAHAGRANVSFTAPRDAVESAMDVSRRLAEQFGAGHVTCHPEVAKLSVSGIGMRSHTGVAIRLFESLAEVGINADMINTSEVRVNVVVDGSRGDEALACLEKAFDDVLVR